MAGVKKVRISLISHPPQRPAKLEHMARTKLSAFDDPATRTAFVEAVRTGSYRGVACRMIGVSYAAYKRYARKKTPEAEAFRAAIQTAEGEVETQLVASVLTLAKKGNMQAVQWYLATKFPERWGSQKKELREAVKLLKELTAERAAKDEKKST